MLSVLGIVWNLKWQLPLKILQDINILPIFYKFGVLSVTRGNVAWRSSRWCVFCGLSHRKQNQSADGQTVLQLRSDTGFRLMQINQDFSSNAIINMQKGVGKKNKNKSTSVSEGSLVSRQNPQGPFPPSESEKFSLMFEIFSLISSDCSLIFFTFVFAFARCEICWKSWLRV